MKGQARECWNNDRRREGYGEEGKAGAGAGGRRGRGGWGQDARRGESGSTSYARRGREGARGGTGCLGGCWRCFGGSGFVFLMFELTRSYLK